MLVVAVAAPLLAFGSSVGRGADVAGAPADSPLPASVLELVVVWLWHTPALHHAARVQLALVFIAEQASFLTAGLLFWLVDRGRRCTAIAGARPARRLLALALTLAHMTLLGALLALSPRPLYAHGGVVDALAISSEAAR